MRAFFIEVWLLVSISGGVAATVALYRTAGRIVLTAFRTNWLYFGGVYYRRSEHPVMFWLAICFALTTLFGMTLLAISLVGVFYFEFVRGWTGATL